MPVSAVFEVMGTVVSIDVRDDIPRDVLAGVHAHLVRVDDVFSPFKPDSSVSRFGDGDIDIARRDADFAHVLRACERLRVDTKGFFDAYATGRFDPSGYVKGWAVETASELLAAAGSTNHMINAGGDIRARGDALPDTGWRVGIVHPADRHAFSAVVDLRDGAVATSGSSERGMHVFDPHSGAPAHGIASVTIIGPDLTSTDAYATAAFAMGMDAPRWLASLAGYESLVVDANGYAWQSDGFAAFTVEGSALSR